jgi:hypothetical protein
MKSTQTEKTMNNTMKLTQKELKDLHRSGSKYVFQYRTRYEVEYKHKAGKYVLVKTGRVNDGLPYTEKGTFAPLNSKEAMGFVYVGSLDDAIAGTDTVFCAKKKLGLSIKHYKNTTL